MIWIEGKSTAWTYLTELELIIPFHPKEEEEEKPPVGRPAPDEIEKKAEELRQKILAASPKTYFPGHKAEIETYASPYQMAENEIQFVDHRKENKARKNAALAELLLTCFVLGLFLLGIYKGQSFLGMKNRVPVSVATQLNSNTEHAARKTNPAPVVTVAARDTAKMKDSLIALQRAKEKAPAVRKMTNETQDTSLSSTVPAAMNRQADKKAETLNPATVVNPEPNTAKKVDSPARKPVVAVPKTTVDEPVKENKEEKKGFLRGLFRKKKKEPSGNQ